MCLAPVWVCHAVAEACLAVLGCAPSAQLERPGTSRVSHFHGSQADVYCPRSSPRSGLHVCSHVIPCIRAAGPPCSALVAHHHHQCSLVRATMRPPCYFYVLNRLMLRVGSPNTESLP